MCLSFSLKTERNFWPTLWYQEVSRKEYLKEYFPGFGNAQIIFISRQNYVSLWPASFCTPRPNLSVIPGISWLPTFAFQYPVMKRPSFLVTANTLQQHKRRLYTWTSPDDQYQNQIDYILLGQRWRSTIQSAKKDWKMTVAQIINSLLPNSDWNWRKWGKPLDHSGMT